MRRVSRTNRVALDWLFDRIKLDSKIQIKYVDTKHQLADTLTEGNFTRHEWNNLFYLFNIIHFSLVCCTKNLSLTSCTKTMAKRMQEHKEENLVSLVSTSSSTVNNCVEKPGGTQSTLLNRLVKYRDGKICISGMYCCRMTSPSTPTTLGTLTPSSRVD